MNIVTASALRNAQRHVPRFIHQIIQLYLALAERGDSLYILIGEGDSVDATRRMLVQAFTETGLPGKLVDTTHGGPAYGSIINRHRFAQLAGVYNTLWPHIPATADAVVFVEGDLMWDAATLLALVDRLGPGVHAASPMIFARDTEPRRFYDIWGFAAGGVNFTNEPPYHACVNGKAVPLDSAGSCVVMTAAAARAVCFPPADMVVGMTKLLAGHGHPVWLQPDLVVEHP